METNEDQNTRRATLEKKEKQKEWKHQNIKHFWQKKKNFCYSIKINPIYLARLINGHTVLYIFLKRKIFTFAKECIISERTSESGSVPMALIRASHIKCHICVRYSGPRTLAHSRRRGMDSAAATRTRFIVKETYSLSSDYI